jgi:glycosyltransferase involved in cell wall biosynthesis
VSEELKDMNIAIVHDWLTNMGGAEKFVLYLHELFPNAPIYTSMCDKTNLSAAYQDLDIRTSNLQKKVKPGKPNHQKQLPWLPHAFESFDFDEYDLVISSSSSCAKGIITSPHTLHICYCHTPMRYLWEFRGEYTKNMSPVKKKATEYFLSLIRIWDVTSSNRVDHFIANSNEVAARIKKHYRRDATVVLSPISVNDFYHAEKDDFYLVVSRLVPYKRVDLAVRACSELGKRLVVIGEGSELEACKTQASDCVTFMGRQSDTVIRSHYAHAKAFLFPGFEDYGLTPLEAQASGTPVIAYGKGGVLDTVIDGKTGIFFYEQAAASLEDAIRRFEALESYTTSFKSEALIAHAANFSVEAFKQRMIGVVESQVKLKQAH